MSNTTRPDLSTRLRQKAETLAANSAATDQKAHYRIEEGDRYRDELNNTVHVINAVNGTIATVVPEDSDEGWRERVSTLRRKVAEGDYTPVGETAPMAGAVAQAAEIPMPDEAQLLYPDAEAAETVAAELGLEGVHEHDLDGETWYMPGADHAAFEDAMSQQEFAGYEDFDACVQANSDKDDPDAYCASIMRQVKGQADTDTTSMIDTKAEFEAGDAVRWSWQGEPVHGRVADVREQATVSGNTITGEDGERDVYVIDEWDDEVGAYREENVAKPEASVDESQKDLPPRAEENYVDSEAWAELVTSVDQSAFTPAEMDFMAAEYDDLLLRARPNEWVYPGSDGSSPVVYRADIPDKYLEAASEDLFVPNAGVADAARKVKDWRDEHGDDAVAGGAPDGEGARRGTQLIEYHDRGEPLAVEYWEEIANYHDRHHPQGNHELDDEYDGQPHKDAGYVSHLNWGGDAGYEQAQEVMDVVESVNQEAAVEMRGAVATEQSLSPETITKDGTNEVDLGALEGELRDAVEADDFYIYGKASIEQWDDDNPSTYIQMDALEGALGRYFESELAPGIISRHHKDIPVGKPVREFEFEQDTTLEIDGDRYEFAAGDVATSHVEDADGDGRPELWLAANIDGETEMGKKTRVLASQGDLNGFSVTVHRNEDEVTSEGRYVTDCDLHAVTIGTDDQIKNPGSEFDVASFKGPIEKVRGVVRNLL